jgi:hypothetical protein
MPTIGNQNRKYISRLSMKTTNYKDTFIETAEDCPVKMGEVPPVKKEEKTAATLQFEMIIESPYKYTSDDIIFQVYATKNKIGKKDYVAERDKFFSKGQPCMRCSPLTKRYGWGAHSNSEGKVAIFAVDSKDYKKFVADKSLVHLNAMRNKKG